MITLAHVHLIETKAALFSAFPALSYLTSVRSAIFNTVNDSNATGAGHMWALDTYSYWSIRESILATNPSERVL